MKRRNKILALSTLKKNIASLRRQGKSIAFTNGCFDILHYGHVSYLQSVKKNNRILIIGLNSDSSIRKIKGPQRPIIAEKQRAYVLAALECIDFVSIFKEETPLKLIQAIRPDVLIKGADWKGKGVVGGDFVKSYGGKVEYVEYISQFSTTKIIESIKKKCLK